VSIPKAEKPAVIPCLLRKKRRMKDPDHVFGVNGRRPPYWGKKRENHFSRPFCCSLPGGKGKRRGGRKRGRSRGRWGGEGQLSSSSKWSCGKQGKRISTTVVLLLLRREEGGRGEACDRQKFTLSMYAGRKKRKGGHVDVTLRPRRGKKERPPFTMRPRKVEKKCSPL